MLCHNGAEFPFSLRGDFHKAESAKRNQCSAWGHLKFNKAQAIRIPSTVTKRAHVRKLADNSEKLVPHGGWDTWKKEGKNDTLMT